MILFVHNRYRTTGGEERVVEDLRWLVAEHIGEPTQMLVADSASLSRVRAGAGLVHGGLRSPSLARAVADSKARIVHAHNIHPTFGWRALSSARAAGARVVLHLHQYRLVCANGVCFTAGADCIRCHGRNTLPGVLRNCRGNRAEALSYGAALALWQRRTLANVDAVIAPSEFALRRLHELGAPLAGISAHTLAPPIRDFATRPVSNPNGYALIASRLAPEKGIDVAIEACAIAGVPLWIAGDGPQLPELRKLADGRDVRFLGRVQESELARLRADAAVALVPSRSAETFGMAAAEAMASGLPVIASRVGALAELVPESQQVTSGDARALAQAIARISLDRSAGERGLERVRQLCAPATLAEKLADIYAALTP